MCEWGQDSGSTSLAILSSIRRRCQSKLLSSMRGVRHVLFATRESLGMLAIAIITRHTGYLSQSGYILISAIVTFYFCCWNDNVGLVILLWLFGCANVLYQFCHVSKWSICLGKEWLYLWQHLSGICLLLDVSRCQYLFSRTDDL